MYEQPFLWLTREGVYPEVRRTIDHVFDDQCDAVRDNLYVLLSALLHVPSVAISRKSSWYSSHEGPSWYTFTHALKAQNLLQTAGLVTITKGRRSTAGRDGVASVMHATTKLDELLCDVPVRPIRLDFSRGEHVLLNGRAISLGELEKLPARTPLAGPLHRDGLLRCVEEMTDLNRNYFSNVTVSFPHSVSGIAYSSNVFLTRMFSSHGMGRLFQRSISYQAIPRRIRSHILINDLSTATFDFSSMHVNLAYFISGARNVHSTDAYSPIVDELRGFADPVLRPNMLVDDQLRTAVKRLVLVAFNTPDKRSCGRAFEWNHVDLAGYLRSYGLSSDEVYDAALRVHPGMKPFICGMEFKPDSIMFHESMIAVRVLRHLRRENVYALPLHDAFIAPVLAGPIVECAMRAEYRKYTGNDIAVKQES